MTAPETLDMKVELVDKTGKHWIQPVPAFIQDIGLCNLKGKAQLNRESIDNLWSAITELREHAVAQLIPEAVHTLINWFKACQPDPINTRQLNDYMAEQESKLMRWAMHEAVETMKKQGMLTSKSNGSGRPRDWSLKGDPLDITLALERR